MLTSLFGKNMSLKDKLSFFHPKYLLQKADGGENFGEEVFEIIKEAFCFIFSRKRQRRKTCSTIDEGEEERLSIKTVHSNVSSVARRDFVDKTGSRSKRADCWTV